MSQAGDVHSTLPAHACEPLHVTSQAHDVPQLTSLHVLMPVQLTLHLPLPHWMPSHAL